MVAFEQLHFNDAFRIMRQLRAHDAIRILKTWTNAWCTSARFHEETTHPCLFGCEAKDCMEHYFNCPFLFALQRYLVGDAHTLSIQSSSSGPSFSIHISDDPLERLGLISTSKDILKIVACTFSAYHAIKFQFCYLFASGGPLHQCKVLPDHIQHSFLASFAETFSAEADEVHLRTRCFDAASFVAFLAAWEFSGAAISTDT